MPILGLSPLNSAEQMECEEQSLAVRGEKEEEEISTVRISLEQSGGFWDIAMDLLKYVFIIISCGNDDDDD